MANVTAKTSSNIFYKARCEAATHNEQLSSREGAADYMSIDRGRLYRIESVPPKQKGVPSFLREYIDTYIVTSGVNEPTYSYYRSRNRGKHSEV